MSRLPGIGPARAAGTVYGLVTVATLLAVESDHSETYPQAVASLALTLAIYWVAHSLADAMAEQVRGHGHLTLAVFARMLRSDWAIIRGALLPLLVLLIVWAVGADQHTGLEIALWSAVVSLFLLEILAAREAGAKGHGLVLEGLFAALVGLAVIGLKLLLK